MRDRVVEQFKAAFGPPTDPEQGRWSLLRGKHSPLNVIVNNPQSDVKATAGIGAARVGIGGAGAVGTGTGSAPIEGVAGRRSIPARVWIFDPHAHDTDKIASVEIAEAEQIDALIQRIKGRLKDLV
jgi:hypothetical protein